MLALERQSDAEIESLSTANLHNRIPHDFGYWSIDTAPYQIRDCGLAHDSNWRHASNPNSFVEIIQLFRKESDC